MTEQEAVDSAVRLLLAWKQENQISVRRFTARREGKHFPKLVIFMEGAKPNGEMLRNAVVVRDNSDEALTIAQAAVCA